MIATDSRARSNGRIELLRPYGDIECHPRACLIKVNFGQLLSRLIAQDERVSSGAGNTGVAAGVPNVMQKVRRETKLEQYATQELGLGLAGAYIDLRNTLLHGFSTGLC